jgi:isocitrate lyase
MGCELVIVARTDALSSTFLDTNIDPADHPFILGCVDPKNKNKLLTFPQAGKISIVQNFRGEDRERVLKMWEENAYSMSLDEAMKFAKTNGFEFYFDWEDCRTDEGYYRIEGSVAFCVKRGLILSDYCDMLWMETPTPDLLVAQEFANGIH